MEILNRILNIGRYQQNKKVQGNLKQKIKNIQSVMYTKYFQSTNIEWYEI